MPLTLLIAEDDPAIAKVVAFGARMNWPDAQVIVAGGGQEALDLFEEHHPGLVVLDVSMPPPDGFEVCQRIREVAQVPILMLTVRDSTMDKVRALELGADDYLTKPFDHLELLARLRALVRRANGLAGPPSSEATSAESAVPATTPLPAHRRFAAGDLTLDYVTHEVRLCGQLVPLTSTEYRLLETLARNAGMTLTHRMLLEEVWGGEYLDATHYLKVFVRRLRRKLGDDVEHPCYIETIRGMGYRFIPAN